MSLELKRDESSGPREPSALRAVQEFKRQHLGDASRAGDTLQVEFHALKTLVDTFEDYARTQEKREDHERLAKLLENARAFRTQLEELQLRKHQHYIWSNVGGVGVAVILFVGVIGWAALTNRSFDDEATGVIFIVACSVGAVVVLLRELRYKRRVARMEARDRRALDETLELLWQLERAGTNVALRDPVVRRDFEIQMARFDIPRRR